MINDAQINGAYMKNPFILISDTDKTEYISARCSLNRAVLAELPLRGIDDEIEGMDFKRIFSTPSIVAEIRALSKRYGIDVSDKSDNDLPKILSEGIVSPDARLRQLSERIAEKFGKRLGLILLTLRTGLPANRAARADWDDSCWRFWAELDTVILTGGLASSMLGRRFKEHIHAVFDKAGVKPYHVTLFDNGRYLGVMGLAQRLMSDNTSALVLDMGHTGIKRALVRKGIGEISGFTPMSSMPSEYMRSKFDSDSDKLNMAVELHRRIVNIVTSTYKELSVHESLDDTVLISIANYVHSGVLNPERGGYAKLSVLGVNYASVLEEDLSGELHRNIKVRLVHDSTAAALYFEGMDNCACVTLGTGFGVGFPDLKI